MMIRDAFRCGLDAARMLTVLPMPGRVGPPRASMLYVFPLVGWIIGGLMCAMAHILFFLSPSMSGIHAVIIVSLGLLLTRGFHIDGLADTFDALGAVGDRTRRLEIMKDSRIGAMGASAIVMVLAGKILSIGEMTSPMVMAALFGVPVCSRWMVVLACMFFPSARPTGIGSVFIGHARLGHVGCTGIFTGCVLFFCLKTTAIPLIGVMALCSLVVAIVSKRSLGGLTGDVLGAIIEISESAGWMFLACRI